MNGHNLKPIGAIAAVLMLLLAALPARAQQVAPWWNSQWQYRLHVKVDINPPSEIERARWSAFSSEEIKEITAMAKIYRDDVKNPGGGKENDPGARDVRVTDAAGKLLPSTAYRLLNTNTILVFFPAPVNGGDFYIYYGNEKTPPQDSDWLPATKSLKLTSLKVFSEFPRSLKAIQRTLSQNTVANGTNWQDHIMLDQSQFPMQDGQSSVVQIEGYLEAEIKGRYGFSLSTGGPGFIFIDGEQVALSEGSGARPSYKWENEKDNQRIVPGEIELEKGYHHLRVIMVEGKPLIYNRPHVYQGIRLGWRPPGQDRFEVIPSEAFGKHFAAQPVRLELQDESTRIWFLFSQHNAGIRVNGRAITPVDMLNASSCSGDPSVEFKWKIDDQPPVLANNLTAGLRDGKDHTVRLEAYRNGRRIGTVTRMFRPHALDFRQPSWKLETISGPSIVYIGEQENLSFRVDSPMAYAAALTWRYILYKKDRPTSIIAEKSGTLLNDTGEGVLSVPIDTSDFDRDAEITVSVSMADMPLAAEKFHIIPVGDRLKHLHEALGHLVNGDGKRAIISTHLVDEAVFRKWYFVHKIGSLFSDTKSIFLYGSQLLNTSCSGEECVSYVDDLRRRCTSAAKGFDFVKRTQKVTGILADIPRFAAVLDERAPDLVIISPGISDITMGVPVRDFKRSIQIMLDLARQKNSSVKMVLVSPPPLTTNRELSELYRQAVLEVATRNRAEFVDIHSLLDGGDYLEKFYKTQLDDSVFYRYPNNDGQAIITDAIWHYVK